MTFLAPPPALLIIGGGYAGAALAIRLLERRREPLRIVIAEPRAEIGRGEAYSTPDPVHLVNGSADRFSLHPDDPDHLARWVAGRGAEPGWTPPEGDPRETFIPRRVFGRYVVGELARAIAQAAPGVTLTHLRGTVTDLARGPEGLTATLADGRTITAGRAVLATGVFPLRPDPALAGPRAAGRVSTPWDAVALDTLTPARDLLIVGASLSMVDTVASLTARGFRGRFHVISRRGHLIEPRRLPPERPPFLDADALPTTTRALLTAIIAERRAVRAEGGDWQAIPAGIRPHIAALWRSASREERLRFTRHLRALWDVSIHRAAPPSFTAVEAARREGRFSARAARLIGADLAGDRVAVRIRPRGRRETEEIVVDGVIDARGHQEHDWRRIEAPLVRALLARGLVRPHDTGFGIDATPEGAVIARDGNIATDLDALGHPLRGVSWESSSLPEQTAQSLALAERLFAEWAQDQSASRKATIA
ncbi:FAD/NAD(P)-binding protein [Paenirhodobacter populi]|uniref:FAD/NAD(P)-binding protein n=1 Tax=Paenirhodobacter populi TaxID=2306993 RepID=UPI000FE300BD|nr:FAD/NAD(P)-binding protein [Sinirhodobacter populi]RWR04584.1 hypothetical protein D2T32_19290 [Sinirhodobacter populi]